jgi:hypothetical protein
MLLTDSEDFHTKWCLRGPGRHTQTLTVESEVDATPFPGLGP